MFVIVLYTRVDSSYVDVYSLVRRPEIPYVAESLLGFTDVKQLDNYYASVSINDLPEDETLYFICAILRINTLVP